MMASPQVLLLLLLLVPSFGGYGADVLQNATGSEYVPLESSLYSKAFVGRWNQQNAVALDDYLQLSLLRNGNTSDGVTLSTPTFYFNGYFRASILLPKGDTAGTVTTFYRISLWFDPSADFHYYSII